jgi:hypothetical protein
VCVCVCVFCVYCTYFKMMCLIHFVECIYAARVLLSAP